MLLGIIGLGFISGFLAGIMAWQATGSLVITGLSYAFFASLGALLFASAAALRRQPAPDDGDLTSD